MSPPLRGRSSVYGRRVLRDAVGLLRCPHCGAAFALEGRVVRCPAGHVFDVARQGYVSLLAGRAKPPRGDDAAMVAAREAFLAAGHYAPLTAAIADAAVAALGPGGPEAGGAIFGPKPSSGGAGTGVGPAGCVLELGAGTGHHLAAVLERLPDRVGLALDVSAPALRRAARAHPRAAAIGADAWGPLPLRDGVVALALSVFAPRNGSELARVVAPGGGLVVAVPAPDHLAELGLLKVDAAKQARLATQLEPAFVVLERRPVRATLELDAEALTTLVAMGPSARHTDPEAVLGRVDPPVAVTLALTVARYRRA